MRQINVLNEYTNENVDVEILQRRLINRHEETKLKIFEEQKLFYTYGRKRVCDITCRENHPVKYPTSVSRKSSF